MKKIFLIIPVLLFAFCVHAQELNYYGLVIPAGYELLGQGIDQWEKVYYHYDAEKAEANIYLIRFDDEAFTYEGAEVITLPVGKIKPLAPVFSVLKESESSRIQWSDPKENDFIKECEKEKDDTDFDCDQSSDFDLIIKSHEKAEWLKNELNLKFKK